MDNVTFNEFRNPALNELAGVLITRNKEVIANVREAQKLLGKALTRRFMNGRDVDHHYAQILEECQSQREFSKRIGLSESVLSNDLRAFRALKEREIEDPQEFKKLLDSKGLPATIKVWEKLPNLLEDPTSLKKDERPKPERTLEKVQDEIQKVADESPHSEIQAESKILLDQIEDLRNHLNKYNPYKYQWDSPAYRKWCRSIGKCMITGRACSPDFHHTTPDGGSGGTGDKLPDVFGFPIDRDLHSKVEDGTVTLTKEQISNAIINTLALFVINNYE